MSITSLFKGISIGKWSSLDWTIGGKDDGKEDGDLISLLGFLKNFELFSFGNLTNVFLFLTEGVAGDGEFKGEVELEDLFWLVDMAKWLLAVLLLDLLKLLKLKFNGNAFEGIVLWDGTNVMKVLIEELKSAILLNFNEKYWSTIIRIQKLNYK